MSFLRRKLVWIPALLVALYALLGFVVAPRVARSQAEAKLPEVLERPVVIREIALNPFSLAVTVRGFSVTEKTGAPFVAFEELFVDASFWRLVTGRIAFDAIRLVQPTVAVSMLADGNLSFADLLPKDEAKPAAPEPKGEPLSITIDALDISNGAFTFSDLQRVEPFSATLQPLGLSLTNFTTEAGRDSRYNFTAKLGEATLAYEGDFSATPLRSAGTLSMQGIRLDAFQPYIHEQSQLELLGGVAGIAARYALDGSTSPLQFVLEDGKITLDGLRIGGEGVAEPLFTLGHLGVDVAKVDLATKKVAVRAVTLEQGVVTALREKSGDLQLVRLATRPKSPAAARDGGTSQLEPSAPDAGTPPSTTVAVTAPSANANWTATLDAFALKDWALSWADESLEYPVKVKLDQLELALGAVAWPLEKPVDLSLAFRWMEQGTFALKGPVGLEPLGGTLHLELRRFDLAPLDGYLFDNGLNGTLKSAALDTTLDATFRGKGDSFSVRGDLALNELSLLDFDDRPVFAAKQLALSGLDVSKQPNLSVALATLRLAGTTLSVQRDEQGELNLSRLSRPPPPGRAAPAEVPEPKGDAGPGLALKLATLQLEDFNVDWLDRTTKPAFATSLRRLGGKVTNLTYPTTQRIGLALAGRVDQAPLKLKGNLLVRGKASQGDVVVSLDGYDLPRATPYSVHYVAQPIERGKLGLELDWKLGQRSVTASNKVLVDQLEFGPQVEEPGPDATKLPLGLAVAVLSDRRGRIDLDLPMTGNLDDPEFKWGGMVLQTLKNLLEKVATAPFSLMAGLFAGQDPDALKTIAFAPGETVPVAAEAEKAASLANLLSERPLLKLEFKGGADPVADRDVLARRQLRASLTQRRGATGSADAGVTVASDADYASLVAAAWRKQKGPTDAGTPDFAQMEAELLAKQVVTDEALDGLRRERAAWLQSALTEKGIDVSRLFVLGVADNTASSVLVELK